MKRVLHSAIDKVYHWQNLEKASRRVVQKGGSGGVDRMDVKTWQGKEQKHLATLRRRLMKDTYRSKPVMRRYIPKPGSKRQRKLGVPAIVDRVCQQAVLNVLQPVFEGYFHDNNHGFRPGRSTKSAAKQVEDLRRAGYRIVVDLDIRDFFDQVDREILMRLVRIVVKDRRVLGLIRGWLSAGVMEDGNVRYQTTGTPQGGVISPLLSNIYLTVLDNALDEAGYQFVRYADDLVILCRTEEEAQTALGKVRQMLAKLKLELNEEKTRVTSFAEGVDFLGFRFTRRFRKIGTKSLLSFYTKVRVTTKRHQGDRPVAAVIEDLNPIIRGWGNYHKEGHNVGMFDKLERWVRKRLRSYIHRRWRSQTKPTRQEFNRMGLLSLRSIVRPKQLHLVLT
jgi:group II intron reverse transcriptase/maturase